MRGRLTSNAIAAAVTLGVVGLLAFHPGTAAAQGRADSAPGLQQFGLGAPAAVADLPAGPFRDRLEGLTPLARARALNWLRGFAFTGADVDFLDADDTGGVLFVDSVLPDAAGAPEEIPLYEQDGSGTLHDVCTGAAVQASGVPSLHSKPGSTKVLFLDLDGGLIPSGTAWGGGPYQTYPYDRDGDYGTVTQAEADDICNIWLRVAEDFTPFDIDVTTEDPVVFTNQTGRVLITRNFDVNGLEMPHSYAGGVAYVGVFGRSDYPTYYSPALVYYNNLGSGLPKYVAEAASHEMGHNLALSHDGTARSSYYSGHGSGPTSWAPIMGVGYYTNMTQWSQGEYPGATQFQDDLAIMASYLGYEPDDHSNGPTAAATLNVVNGSVDDWGLIETRADIDMFVFETAGGTVQIDAVNAPDIPNAINRPEVGNLDIRLELMDATGATLAVDDVDGTPDAQISITLAAGTYYLSVSGVGDASTPYNDYGSLGEYHLLGSVPTDPAPNAAPVAGFSYTTNGLTATFLDTSSDSDGVIVSWMWNFGDGAISTAQNPGHTYASGGTRQVTLSVTDNDGAVTQAAHSVSVVQPDATPPTITAPTDVTAEATGPLTSVAIGTATASDAVDPSPLVTNDAPAQFPLGATVVTWTATDASGNTASDTQLVTVADTTPPAITVLGGDPAVVQQNGTYTEAGATALDAVDGDLTASITQSWSPALDISTAGDYTVTYRATDAAGNIGEATRTVTVVAAQPLAAPSDLTALVEITGRGRNKTQTVTLNWTDNSAGEVAFDIERCEETGKGRNKTCTFDGSTYATVGANITTFPDDGATNGTFHYRVRARDAQGNYSGYSNEAKI